MNEVFTSLNSINVNGRTEKKPTANGQTLTYLSWAWAWAEVMKRYPDAQYTIWKDDCNRPYIYDENLGYMVFTTVTIKGVTREMWLPVMDSANAALKNEEYTIKTKYKDKRVGRASMTDINKTIMRCLTKNLAMFGLGLYIYAGEDLPEGEDEKASKPQIETIKKGYSEIDKLLAYFKVDKLEDLTVSQATNLIQQLNNKKNN